MANDDDELFDLLSRELSRFCSTLLDPTFDGINLNAATTRGADGWDMLHPNQDIHHFLRLEIQFQHQQLEESRRQQDEYMLLLQAEQEQLRIFNHQIGRNRTSTKQINMNNNKHSSMRVLINGEAGTQQKSASAGTGVFLPRSPGGALPQPSNICNNKPGFPTVLVPERVVQALNLNLERMRNVPRPPGLRQW